MDGSLAHLEQKVNNFLMTPNHVCREAASRATARGWNMLPEDAARQLCFEFAEEIARLEAA